MSVTLALPLLLAAQASSPLVSSLPSSVPPNGLLELTTTGEVVLLPRHNTSPFDALMATRSARSCSQIERTLMDVTGYPELWKPIKAVRVLKQTPKRVEYEFDVDIVLTPTIKGIVENPSTGVVVFHDIETQGRFWYQLRDVPSGCQILYHLHQPKGERSGFVKLITAIERGSADSGELIGALTSLRGVGQVEDGVKRPPTLTSEGQRAWDELSAHGTVLRTIYAKDHHLRMASKRRVARPVNEILWEIRNRARYKDKLDLVKRVKDGGLQVDYTFGYFGGRVRFTTQVSEEGDVNGPGGLVITERLTDGDVKDGHWRWTVRAVEGGTEVDLFLDVDLAKGSLIMRNFAKQDPAMAYALPTQITLTMMAALVGGKPLPLPKQTPVATKSGE